MRRQIVKMLNGKPQISIQEISMDDLPELLEQPVSVLTPRQFEWMLAFTGLDDVWNSLEAAAKDSDRALYANLRAQRASNTFLLDLTLSFVNEVKDIAANLHPDVDLSEEAVRAAWSLAGAQSFGVLSPGSTTE